MSACSVSSVRLETAEARRRAANAITGLALLLALLIPQLVHASGQSGRSSTGSSDSVVRSVVRGAASGLVRRVVIGDEGVQITGDDSLDVSVGPRGVNATVDVNGERHRVRVHGSGVEVVGGRGQNVRIMGPVVQVDGGDDDMVRVFADAEVPAGQRLDGNVVAVFGSVTVHGQVTGSVVAVMGSVTLDSTAHVGEDAVAVGGALAAAPGSTVGGESVSLGFLPIAWGLPALPVLLACVMVGWLSTLFFGWLLHLLFADRMMRAAVTASRRTGLSFVLGLASAPLMVIAFVLLLITVLGIPLALLLPVAYWLLTWAGQLAATHVLGCKLMGRSVSDRWSFAPLALGTLFIAGFFAIGALLGSGTGIVRTGALFFDLLGTLMLVGLTVIGTGAFLVSRLGSQPADVLARPPMASHSGSPGAMPGPAPGAVATPPIV